MLALDSPRWATMRKEGAYSTVVPSLLARLYKPANFMDEEGAFRSLKLAVIRCGQVDEVSYAAVPHLLSLAKSGGLMPWDYLGLVAEIEARRTVGMGSTVPDDLARAYFDALQGVPQLVADCKPNGASENVVGRLAGVLAVAYGQPRLGMAIIELGYELQEGKGKISCSECGEAYAVPKHLLRC